MWVIVRAKVDEKEADGLTPLHLAAGCGHGSIVKLLEAHEAKLKGSGVEKPKCNPKAQGNSYPNKNNPTPQNARSKLPVIAASMLAITGVATGIAIAVYLEMLAVGIAVGACCLVAAAIIYCCNKPSKSLESSNAEGVTSEELKTSYCI